MHSGLDCGVASRLAIQQIRRVLMAGAENTPTVEVAHAALQQANEEILQVSRSNPQWGGMGATLSFLWVDEAGGVIGQVGDSRIYRMREGWLDELSVDHLPVGRLRQSGKLSEADGRRHPSRHVIDQCLSGGDAEIAPDCEATKILAGDVILLCSDGLLDGVPDAELAGVMGAVGAGDMPLPKAVRELIERANRLSGRDNVTVIVARFCE
ncbi:MAG: serine/threonine-protein phosphatase [Candidatus Synoicihabitans palmerolidicus]|nr:serine/threonine-protein phosphatase [Candidatus Synoicihabitans palmerolidicus]